MFLSTLAAQVRFKQLFEGDPQAARRGHALYELFREEVRAAGRAEGAAAQVARVVRIMERNTGL